MSTNSNLPYSIILDLNNPTNPLSCANPLPMQPRARLRYNVRVCTYLLIPTVETVGCLSVGAVRKGTGGSQAGAVAHLFQRRA